jgi:adenylate cyclase
MTRETRGDLMFANDNLAQPVRCGMEAPELERRLAAIVAADVEGYSRLMHEDEEATVAALSANRAVVDELISTHRGRIANTAGDSVLAEFSSVLDAVICAIEIQRALAGANELNPERAMRFRIGINVGDVMVKDGDIFGDGVNVAARLESLAEGGGICVSRGVRDHLRHRSNFVFEDLGEQLVKNIAHPVRAFRLRLDSSTPDLLAGPAIIETAGLGGDPEKTVDTETAVELAFWDSVKDGGPAELRVYLDRFPDGTFADLALARLAGNGTGDHEAGSAATGPDEAELTFWESIKDSHLPDELNAYLQRYPEGHFAPLAKARLAHVDNVPEEAPATNVGDAIELAFWESIADANDFALFSAYLEKYPEGKFAVIARSRLNVGRD